MAPGDVIFAQLACPLNDGVSYSFHVLTIEKRVQAYCLYGNY